MKFIKNFLKKAYICFLKILPIKKNRIYFVSNFGERYSCNPKAFFEHLYKNHKDEFDFYYCLNDKNSNELPSDVKRHKYKSIKDLYYLYTSKYIINNFRFHKLFNKKKGQVYVQTWHGGPIPQKKVEKDAEDKLPQIYIEEAKQDSKNMDLLLTGSTMLCDIFKKGFWFDGEVTNFGTPRYDIFFKDNAEFKNNLRKKLNIDENSKIVLYAPTFRNSITPEDLILDNETLIAAFKKYYNSPITLLYRFHPHQTEQVKNLTFEEDNIINVTSYPDSVDLEILSDCLITDFSSCLSDFLVLNKPCFNLVKNIESYLDNERSLYIDLKEIPYPVLKDEKSLEKYLLNEKNIEKNISKKVESFKQKIGLTEKGTACKSLYEKLKKF